MMKNQTAEELRNQATLKDAQVQESFDRCDTDGFLSQWATGLEADLLRRQAEIVENGGKASFPALFDLSGRRVRAKLIKTHPPFAPWTTQETWALCDSSGKFIKFIAAFPVKASTMERKGYREGTELAKAAAKIVGSGYGLSGNAWVATVRLDKGYPEDSINPI